MRFIGIILLLLAIKPLVQGQVQHNFKMDPQKTDCHELELTANTLDNIARIEATKFRLTEQLQLSKFTNPQRLVYYSCDGKVGYVISTESEAKIILIEKIKKTLWDSFVNSDDPIEFYQTNFKKDRQPIE